MLRLALLGLIGLIVLSTNGRQIEDTRKVHLEGLGNVSGVKFWDGEFYEFFGIPFAGVPTGRDKFKPPLPLNPWNEDMKANKLVMCQQVMYSQDENEGDLLYGVEDCLIASLMVPKIASETNLVPIIVYIHSGAYSGGSGNMAKYYHLARQDVIVANLNYRLGAIGFACLGTEEIPGNAALKDIVAGLKFIKKYAKSFGGDPDNITLAGFSVGATLAEIVALSKETRGMIDKLILDSGSALTPFAVDRQPIETARNLAKSIGYKDTGNIEDLNEFLLQADTQDILGVSRNFFLKNSTFGFAPCIENPANPGAVLTESPLDTLQKGNYGDFSLMTGFANMEGISRTSQFEGWMGLMNQNLANFLPADLVFKNDKERDEFIKELKKYYFNGKPLTLDSVQEYIDYFGDVMFKYAIMKSAKLHAENLKRSIYMYEFTYVGKLSTKHAFMDRIRGASHRDASAYILDFYDWTRNYTDLDMRDLMTTIVGDYLKLENPTAYESSLITVKWLKYNNKDTNYLDMGDKFEMKKELFTKGFQLWDKIYKKNYWNPTVVNPEAYKGKPKAKTAPAPEEKPTVKEPAVEVSDTPKVQEPAAKNAATADGDKKPAAAKTNGNTRAQKPAVKDAAPADNDKKPAASDPSCKSSPTPSAKSTTDSKAKSTEQKAAKPVIIKNPSVGDKKE